jgi:hypothetical protein
VGDISTDVRVQTPPPAPPNTKPDSYSHYKAKTHSNKRSTTYPVAYPSLQEPTPTTTPTTSPTNLSESKGEPMKVFYGLSTTGLATATIALLALKREKTTNNNKK